MTNKPFVIAEKNRIPVRVRWEIKQICDREGLEYSESENAPQSFLDLAALASARRGEDVDIDEWAHRLANDVADADE